MITMIHFGIPFKLFWFYLLHINDAYHYVLFLFELPATQANIVMYTFKQIK